MTLAVVIGLDAVVVVQAICAGFMVPITHRKASGWEAFLKELGLVPCPAAACSKTSRKSQGIQSNLYFPVNANSHGMLT